MSEEEISEKFESPPWWVLVCTYINYVILTLFGYFREFLRKINWEKNLMAKEPEKMKDFAPLYNSFEGFYTRNIYMRVRDNFNRPICSVPGGTFFEMERKTNDSNWTFELTGKKREMINLGSYNYLGYAENHGFCNDQVLKSIDRCGVGVGSSRNDFGTYEIHEELEKKWSQFLGTEETLTFGMGFATNSLNIAALVGKGSCIISDELNHSSLILGCRLSGAKIKIYRHNDMDQLEKVIRDAIVHGQDRTHRPFKKILIIVEGIYSMEGSIVNLPKVIELKKKYNCYLYVDEAHSIGALGKTGRGVVEHFGANVLDVDIMMGTFTKSFGASGGYISGKRNIIQQLKHLSYAQNYATSMAPGICQQILAVIDEIQGPGLKRLRDLRENTNYFRKSLHDMGFIVFGDDDSPVVPMMLYFPAKLGAFSRMMTESGIAVVVVGFPAAPLNGNRVRFCLSSSNTRAQIELVLQKISEIGDVLILKHSKRNQIKPIREKKCE